MTQYLLDTNHASPLVTPDHPLRLRLQAALSREHTFSLTALNITELHYGFGTLPRAVQNYREWALLRPSFRVYAIDEDDALKAAELQIQLRRRGWQLGSVDALIAVIAVRNNLTLLTTDGDFNAVPDLKHENWLLAV